LDGGWFLEAEEEKCREIVERRELVAIGSAGVKRGELMVARVRLVKRPGRICPTEDRVRDEEARKLIRDDWMGRESMERGEEGKMEQLYTG
jgi:hypothetical protein